MPRQYVKGARFTHEGGRDYNDAVRALRAPGVGDGELEEFQVWVVAFGDGVESEEDVRVGRNPLVGAVLAGIVSVPAAAELGKLVVSFVWIWGGG